MVSEAKRISGQQPQKIGEKKRGSKEKTNWYDKTLTMLMYYREYRTFEHIEQPTTSAKHNVGE